MSAKKRAAQKRSMLGALGWGPCVLLRAEQASADFRQVRIV
jgi:hypothetical protein